MVFHYFLIFINKLYGINNFLNEINYLKNNIKNGNNEYKLIAYNCFWFLDLKIIF